MTEAEAKERMCPVLAIIGALSPATAKSAGIRCIASECMMWRGYCGLGGEPLQTHEVKHEQEKAAEQ